MIKHVKKWALTHRLIAFSRSVSPWGFDGASLYEVSHFFIQRMTQGEIAIRARSIAFSFFLAIFPAIIFLFSLIPFIPVDNLQEELLLLLRDLLPPHTYEASRQTIEDIVTRQRYSLLSLGFIFTLYISSDGVMSMINAFNAGNTSKSHFMGMRLRCIGLTLFLALLILITLVLIIASEVVIYYLSQTMKLTSGIPIAAIVTGKWILLLLLCFTAISCLYYFGSVRHVKYRFISPGSLLATLLIVLTSLAFNFFISNFGQYNKIYGSIGTLIILLLWLDFNCRQLIIGYELNAAIRKANQGRSTLVL
jgi:membrane protein